MAENIQRKQRLNWSDVSAPLKGSFFLFDFCYIVPVSFV